MNRGIIPFILVLFILLMVAIKSASNTNTVRAKREARGGCAGCHVKLSEASLDWGIHLNHYSSPEFLGDCWSCHLINEGGNFRLIEAAEGKGLIKATKDVVEQMVPYFKSWATSDHLDHLHAQRSVTCGDCHGRFFPKQRLAAEQCLKCHGSYQHLVALSKDVYPNPHDSHFGKMRCTRCHKAHEESVLYCNKCHVFDLEVPYGGSAFGMPQFAPQGALDER